MRLRTGDVLLLPKGVFPDVYEFFEKYLGKDITDALAKIEKHNYIHADLYIGGSWVISATPNGVHLLKYSLKLISKFDIYRYPYSDIKFEMCINKQISQFLNMPYDFVSLLLNGFIEFASFGLEPLERFLEDKFSLYNTPFMVICSELIARIYDKCGVKIESNDEFVTPDDLAQHLEKIF